MAQLVASACWGKPTTAVVPRAIAGLAASCTYCRPSSSLSSPNPAGYFQTRKVAKFLSGWHPALLGQFMLAEVWFLAEKSFFSVSQEVQEEALQGLGGDGSCEAACTQHEDWSHRAPVQMDGLSLSPIALPTYPS